MHPYRTHVCGALRRADAGKTARLSGWIHRKRDHGHLLFIDLRDSSGVTQCVIDRSSPLFHRLETSRLETVLTVTGPVVIRDAETRNPGLPTGEVELRIGDATVQGPADSLPLQVNSDVDYGEEVRLRYRFLDLRREKMQRNIMLRCQIVAALRARMQAAGFTEFQTPILTATSPEGARDYVVPSRIHPGRFYALPQAPQQFKQLLMVSGFDRYFQIAPCFRDEDARADRSPGEFYQLDFEMSFVTQEDVFAAIEPVIAGVFTQFAGFGRDTAWSVTAPPFPRIPYATAMLKYGTDKPDLRNPLEIADVSAVFAGSGFQIFARSVAAGKVVRAIPAPGAANRPRSWFDRLNDWARQQGAPGLGYIQFGQFGQSGQDGQSGKDGDDMTARGPIARFLDPPRLAALRAAAGVGAGDAVFFACDTPAAAAQLAGQARTRIGGALGLIADGQFRFCWIVDYPMYEREAETGRIVFSHNPFSMPRGGLAGLEAEDKLSILADQYDIVCNGVELSSGAIRNHRADIMLRAFEIAGYPAGEVEARFGAMLNAFRFGAPPHGGAAPGIDRMVMLLAGEDNIREVTAFPMTQKAEDILMGAPAAMPPERLRELHLRPAWPRPPDRDAARGG